jgi:asparagine synthase (glutamine-hydrolysing)
LPNLVGIWHPGASEVSIRQRLTKQLDRVRISNIIYSEYPAVRSGFGMALQDHGILDNGLQPVQTNDGRFILIIDGEIYNAPELRKIFYKDLPEQNISAPELCLKLLVKHGRDVLKLFNGLFCLVLYDCVAQQVSLISDRFGFRSIYYVIRHNMVIFGSELKALCAIDSVNREIDEIGTLELFCYGSHVMDRTWIKDYVRLSPATVLTVDEEGIQSRTYWVYKYNESAQALDQPTYYVGFRTLLDRAVERCMAGSHRIGLFLSGGFDSRSIAASIRSHHLPIPAFTFGHSQSRDIRYATMLAQRLGLEHYRLAQQGPYLAKYCHAIVWRTEGMSIFAKTISVRYHQTLKDKMDIILVGFLGEHSGSHTWPQLLLARSRRATMDIIFSRMTSARLGQARRIFNQEFLNRTFRIVRERFEKSFDSVQNDHPINVADCWNFINLKPRETYHSPSVDRHLFEVRAPHMDLELVNFLLDIPPYSRLEQRVYKKMIAYGFPSIRDVPCTNSGLPVNPHFFNEYGRMVSSYLARKSIAPLHRIFYLKRSLGREFRNLDDDFRVEPELRDILFTLLDGQIFPAQIFNYSGIEQLVQEHYAGVRSHWEMLSILISWGLAVKYFLHDDLSEAPVDIFSLR